MNPIKKIYSILIRQITHRNELITYISGYKKNNLRIGFVPTMGALHEGHLSLIRKCKKENDLCVASIFINPTQFNDKKDFENYPRVLDKDIQKLETAGCDIVFTPEEEDIYPGKDYTKTIIDLGNAGLVMEAAHRPGHYDGVVTIVRKLFDLVQPDFAYFGQKDYQQFQVIKKLINYFKYNIEIVICETARESDGLAMSSRNMLLNPDERKLAPIIYSVLSMAKELLNEKSVEEVKEWAANTLIKEKLINFEYFDIVDAGSLKSINSLQEAEQVIMCTAMKIGKIRLIDNMFVKE